jgi:histone H4
MSTEGRNMPAKQPVRGYGGKHFTQVNTYRRAKGVNLQEAMKGVTKPSLRRLARRGGVKRISGDIYTECRSALRVFLSTILRDATTYTEHAHRKTVTTMDVIYALKRNNTSLYGFGFSGSR